MSGPRDYAAFVSLLSHVVPIETRALSSDRSIGGYLALRVAADQFLQSGEHAFDIDFYRDERAEGGLCTRLMEEPASEIASAWLVAIHVKHTAERFMSQGALDFARVRQAIAHDELLRIPHGEKIRLDRAGLNAIALLRGFIPSWRVSPSGPAPTHEFPSFETRQ